MDEALKLLEKEDEVAAQLVSLRFFAGIPNVEAAKMLGLSESTAKRTWDVRPRVPAPGDDPIVNQSGGIRRTGGRMVFYSVRSPN